MIRAFIINKYINEKVKVKLKWLVNNRKNIKGIIKVATNEHVVINDDKESYDIKYDAIDSARLKIWSGEIKNE